MKKITHLDMSAIMDAYTAKVIAEEKRRDANRKAFEEGRPFPYLTGGQWQEWNISDRH